jgi:small subunit ribosomal protein S15
MLVLFNSLRLATQISVKTVWTRSCASVGRRAGLDSIASERIHAAVEPIMSLATANQDQITNHKIHVAIRKFQVHRIDTGSSGVQIAVLTEKIRNLARHFALHRKDHHSKRGFQSLISKRRQLMKHLRRHDFEAYAAVVKELSLETEAAQLPLKI